MIFPRFFCMWYYSFVGDYLDPHAVVSLHELDDAKGVKVRLSFLLEHAVCDSLPSSVCLSIFYCDVYYRCVEIHDHVRFVIAFFLCSPIRDKEYFIMP